MLGLRCYTWAFSSCGDEGSSLLWCVGHCGGCSCCGVLALGVQALVVVVFLGMWNLPGLGIEPVSHLLQGRFLSTVPPGKPPSVPFEDALEKLQISSLQAPGIHLKISRLLWLVWFLSCSKPNLWSLHSECLNPCGWNLFVLWLYLLYHFTVFFSLLWFISFVSIMLHDIYIT